MDTSQRLTCPVPGCGWYFDPQNPEWIVLRDAGEGGRPTAEARDWLAGWEEIRPEDGRGQPGLPRMRQATANLSDGYL